MVAYAEYIKRLHADADAIYEIAEEARSKGFDPKNAVEIPKANDLADRTQKLLDFLHPRQTAEQIRELTKVYDGNRERVAIEIARIVCAESYLYGKIVDCPDCGGSGEIKKGNWVSEAILARFGKRYVSKTKSGILHGKWRWPSLKSKPKMDCGLGEDSQFLAELAIYHGVCAGLAVLTEGILVAPLEGVVSARFITTGTVVLPSLFHLYRFECRWNRTSTFGSYCWHSSSYFGLKNQLSLFEEVERHRKKQVRMQEGYNTDLLIPKLKRLSNHARFTLMVKVGGEVTGQRDLPRVKTNKVREGMLRSLWGIGSQST